MAQGPDTAWRFAEPPDDNAVVHMCLALNTEDPGDTPVVREQVHRTLAMLREKPARGKAVVAEVDGQVVGYALLISFWSNELGGEICIVDELYIVPALRCRGLAGQLLESLRDRSELWPPTAVAIGLEVSPANSTARRLFVRHGFVGANTAMHLRRRLQAGSKT